MTIPTTNAAIVPLEPPQREQLDAERAVLLHSISLPDEVTTPSEYERVAALEFRVTQFLARAEPLFDDHCQQIYKAWKSACRIRAAFTDGPKQIKAKARALLAAFVQREERERQIRERELAELARVEEAARNVREAEILEAQGERDIAAAVRSQPVQAVSVVLPSAVPDVGMSYTDLWTWEVAGGESDVNRRRALAMSVPASVLPYVKWDDAALTACAKRYKGTIRVPGIEFFSRKVPVRR